MRNTMLEPFTAALLVGGLILSGYYGVKKIVRHKQMKSAETVCLAKDHCQPYDYTIKAQQPMEAPVPQPAYQPVNYGGRR